MKRPALALNLIMVTLLTGSAGAQHAQSNDFRVLEAVKRRDAKALAALIRANRSPRSAGPLAPPKSGRWQPAHAWSYAAAPRVA